MGTLRVGFLKLVIISYSGDTFFFFFLMCRKARRRGLRVIYKMRPGDFYIAHNGLMRVTGTLGRSRFPKLR